MQKQLYIIEYDSAHWCGGESHCVTWAESPDQAVLQAERHMDETMRELFADEYADCYDENTCEGYYDEEAAFAVISVEVLDERNPHWDYYQDPEQRVAFYPEV